MEYPGRFIIMGRSKDNADKIIAVYGITGRSPSSQARKLVLEENRAGFEISIEVTDEEVLSKGNPDLLVYPAIMGIQNSALLVSNGKQTEDLVKGLMEHNTADKAVIYSAINWSYEPDAPNYTPRISAAFDGKNLAMGVTRKHGTSSTKINTIQGLKLELGDARLIATYSGENQNPLPSFKGDPIPYELGNGSLQDIAQHVYDSLSPENSQKDFRVAVAAVACPADEGELPYIINRCEREEQ